MTVADDVWDILNQNPTRNWAVTDLQRLFPEVEEHELVRLLEHWLNEKLIRENSDDDLEGKHITETYVEKYLINLADSSKPSAFIGQLLLTFLDKKNALKRATDNTPLDVTREDFEDILNLAKKMKK